MANNFRNAKLDLTTTDVTTLFTSGTATRGIFRSILISNDSGSNDSITLTLINGSEVFSIYKSEAVNANSTNEVLTTPLVIEEHEILKVTAKHTNRDHGETRYLEVT